jgi:hypothetical protein
MEQIVNLFVRLGLKKRSGLVFTSELPEGDEVI